MEFSQTAQLFAELSPFLLLASFGVLTWFCFSKEQGSLKRTELKYWAGYSAISVLSLLLTAFSVYAMYVRESPGADINFMGVMRKLWLNIVSPYLQVFAFLSGVRLLIVYLRSRRQMKRNATPANAPEPRSDAA